MKQSTANKIAVCLGICFFIFLACLKASHTGRIPVIPPRIPNTENSMESSVLARPKTNQPSKNTAVNNSQTIQNTTNNNKNTTTNTTTVTKPVTKPSTPKPTTPKPTKPKPSTPGPTTPEKPVSPTPTYGDIWKPEIEFSSETKSIEVILRSGMKIYDAVYDTKWKLITTKTNSAKFTPETYKYIELDENGKDIVTYEFNKNKELVKQTYYIEGNKAIAEYEYSNSKIAKITTTITSNNKLVAKETQTFEDEKLIHFEKELYENDKVIAKYVVDYDTNGNIISDKYYEYTYYANGDKKEVKLLYVEEENLILDVDMYDEEGKLAYKEKTYHSLDGVKERTILSEYNENEKKFKETDSRYEEDVVIYTEINEYNPETDILIKKTVTADDMTEKAEFEGTTTLYKYYIGDELMEMMWEDKRIENGLTVYRNKYFDVETEKVLIDEISYLTPEERLVKLICFYFADDEYAGYVVYEYDEDGEIVSEKYYNMDDSEKTLYEGFIPYDLVIMDDTASIDIYIDEVLTANVDIYWNINEQYQEPVEATTEYKFVQKNKTETLSTSKYTPEGKIAELQETHHINETETMTVKQYFEHPEGELSKIEIKSYTNGILIKADIDTFDVNGLITEHISIGYDNYGNIRTRNTETYTDGILVETTEEVYDTLGNVVKKTQTVYEESVAIKEYYYERYFDEELNAYITLRRTTLLINNVIIDEEKQTEYIDTPNTEFEKMVRDDDGNFGVHWISYYDDTIWHTTFDFDEDGKAYLKVIATNTTPYIQKDYIPIPGTEEWLYIRYWEHTAPTNELLFTREATYDENYNILYWTQYEYEDGVAVNSFICDENGNPIS